METVPYEQTDILDIQVWYDSYSQEWVTAVFFTDRTLIQSRSKDTTQPTRRYA